jgi:hypothetical protein
MNLKLDADNPADREKLRRAILDLVAGRKMPKQKGRGWNSLRSLSGKHFVVRFSVREIFPPSTLTEYNSASAAEKSKLRLEQYKRFYGKMPDTKAGLLQSRHQQDWMEG